MLRRNEENSRAGSKWLPDEDEKLVKDAVNGTILEKIRKS